MRGGALLGPAVVQVDEDGGEGLGAVNEGKGEGRVAGQEVEGRALPAAVPLQDTGKGFEFTTCTCFLVR